MENNEIKKLVLKKLKNGKVNIEKLSISLSITTNDLKKILSELQNDLLIKEKNGFYFPTIDNFHKIGKLMITKKGHGVVKISENEVYFIDESNLNNCIDGDIVLIKILDKMNRSAIVEDKKEQLMKVVGTIRFKNNKIIVDLDNPALNIKLKLDKNQGSFKDGNKVLVKFLSKKNKLNYKAKEVEIFGNEDEIGVDITSIIKELGIEDTFTREELDEASKIKTYVDENDYSGRRDLRDEKIFTIDSDESKDFDDAIGIQLLDNNHYLVKVCIADVAHYIKEGSILDETAKNRGSSIYLLDRTIPMLPFELSNGICSLNPLEDRLAITYEIEFDENGYQVDYDIYLSVICSRMRMTYNRVEDVLQNENSEYYKEFQTELRLLNMLCKKINKIRMDNGYVDIDCKQRKINYDCEIGKIVDITVGERRESEKIIEELMIATNKVGTMYAKEHKIKIFHRVQDEETRETIEEKLNILAKMGFKKFEIFDNYSNNDIIREVLKYYQNDENLDIITRIITNSNRAYYTVEENLHSSLNEENYSRITSPIRRYSDLYSSRQIKKCLRKEYLEEKSILEIISQINEQNENIRLCCKRQKNLKLGEYYYEKNDIMAAKVVNVTERMLFIQLEDLTSGVLLLKNLKGYKFNDKTFSYVNKSNETIKVGDVIFVQVINIDKYLGRMDFKIYKK